MGAQHTPGPWRVEVEAEFDEEQPEVYVVHEGTVCTYTVIATMGLTLAVEPEQKEANARLIAAAPELLEAGGPAVEILEWYIEFLHRIPADELELHPYIPAVEEAFDRLSAAIAKATGAA